MSDEKAEKEVKKSETALREEEIQAFWEREGIFKKSVEKPAGGEPEGSFVFYDGPPFATGLPHYGHILASAIKDAVPRYHTMRGKRVERKWGWDCHGLPLENLIEERLGLKSKKDIEELGVETFNETARGAVLEYANDWKRIIPRMGRWADMDDDYKTMDATYTESVWNVFKGLHEKGLVYEGFKSMHLCPRCGTTLSNFEVNLGYKDIKDVAVTVKLPLVDEPETSLLVWTTTPWTLPGNMAAAVHEDHDYVTVDVKNENGTDRVILAKARLQQLDTDEYEIVEEMKGKDLVGKSYIPPFDYFYKLSDAERAKLNVQGDFKHAWKIYHADYVELGEEGTGAVHLAPAYGDEDMELAKSHGVPIVHHVDGLGRFMDLISDLAGQMVKPKDEEKEGVSHLDGDIAVIRKMKETNTLLKKENITHSYPLCWRCSTPLLNYATTSWFVEVTKIKDKLVAENEKVNWVPEYVGKNRFGKWLEGARDWAVSRQRYWGAPLPIWKNPDTNKYKVFGSLGDMKEFVPKSGNSYYLMRHGEATSNLETIISSNIENDDPLTENGTEQVKHACKDLKGASIDVIIHSGFVRTKATAEIIAEEIGVSADALVADERIAELQMTDAFEGKTWDEYNAQYPTWEERYTKNIDEFENRRDVQTRVSEFLYDIEKQYSDKNILIVGHAASLFGLECAAAGADIETARKLYDAPGYLDNAEVRELPFVPLPHNREYVLDYHRPYIDEIELFEGDTKLERVPDVFDCWFESGSMPYGQQHYPFENLDQFNPEKKVGYPANFIAEGLDQTRGWFYSLIVLGTALFGRSPYENVIVNGLVLAEDGRKMSKSLKNYPDPMDVADTYGADTMRFYLLSSPLMRGEDLNFSEKELAELARKNIGRLHNVLAFYELYADGSIAPSTESKHVLDRWIVARLQKLVNEVTDGYDAYELDRAARPVTDFIDDLSVWYIRRSRDRFKVEGEDKEAALGTLRYVLSEFAQVIAPTMPFYADYLYRSVKEASDPESVHLTRWPERMEPDAAALEHMHEARAVVTAALEARNVAGIKVRQPLQKLTVKSTSLESQADLHPVILDEINVKELAFDSSISEEVVLDTTISEELKVEGYARELTRQLQDIRKKMGLMPEDRVTLTVETDDAGKSILETHKDTILTTINAEDVSYEANDGTELSVAEHSFKATLAKV